MNQLTFDEGLGAYTVSVNPDAIALQPGIGGHYLQVKLEVGIPELQPQAGRLLTLETALCFPRGGGLSAPLAFANLSVPFRPTGEIRPHTIEFLLTNAQLADVERDRMGDLHLELRVRGFLPQATASFPGCSEVSEHFSIAESRWRNQLVSLGRSLGVEMVIPFPAGDGPRQEVADLLREAQRLLGSNEIDSALVKVRLALESVRGACGWNWPGQKERLDRTPDERWAWIRAASEDQASGGAHKDRGTKDYEYSRAEAETLIPMTAALLTIVP